MIFARFSYFVLRIQQEKSNNDYLHLEEILVEPKTTSLEPSNEGCVTHVQNSTIKALPSDLLLHIV